MADNVTLKRIVDLVAQTDIDDGVYTIIDSTTGAVKKYPLGSLICSIAPIFDSSTAYAAGEYCNYNGQLYKFDEDHAAGSWTGSDATATVLADVLAEVGENVAGLITDVSDLKADVAKKADVIIDSVFGSIASFPDGADDMPVKSLICDIDPVQDLHGYDHPWPAGGGVNKFVCGDATGVSPDTGAVYGLNVTCNGSDETITVSGTPTWTSTGVKSFRLLSTRAGSYWGDAPVTHDYSDMNGKWFVVSKSSNISDVTASATINSDGTINISLTNTDVNEISLVLKLVIYEGSTAPAAWTPYSNICPISGWTGMEVEQTGKNLFDVDDVNGWEVPSGGAISSTGNVISLKILDSGGTKYYHKQKYKGNTTVTFSGKSSKGYARVFIRCRKFDDSGWMTSNDATISGFTYMSSFNGWYVDVSANLTWNKTASIPDCLYWQVGVGYNNVSVTTGNTETISEFQFELGSTAPTTYEPYHGTTLPITWQTEAGTVRGGYLDTLNGNLVVTMVSEILSSVASVSTSGSYIIGNTGIAAKPVSAHSVAGNIKANILKTVTMNELLAGAEYAIAVGNVTTGGPIKIYVPGCADKSSYDTWLSSNNLQIVYELSSPITYQLDPITMDTFIGQNNIFCNTGDTSVEYPADTKLYIDKKLSS